MKKLLLLITGIYLLGTGSAYAQETTDQGANAQKSQPAEQGTSEAVQSAPASNINNININVNVPDEPESKPSSAQESQKTIKTEQKPEIIKKEQEPEKKKHSAGHAILMYLPNRVFDVFDIVRARVRIGPGISAGARVTQGLEVQVGAYRSLWLGLHGPRTKPKVPWIAGLEGRQGAKAIFLGEVEETRHSPNYQFDEIGVDAQAAVAGVSIGFSITEIFDLITGLLFIDISSDDL